MIAETGTASDPFFTYVRLGDSIEDGLFGWITIAINVSAAYDTATYSFQYTADGGEAVTSTTSTDAGAGGAPPAKA